MGAFTYDVCSNLGFFQKLAVELYARYPIVARAWSSGLAFRPSARASKGILHTNGGEGVEPRWLEQISLIKNESLKQKLING